MKATLEHQLQPLISALSEQTKAITLLTQAIGQMLLNEAEEADEKQAPPAFDLSGKPIVIR